MAGTRKWKIILNSIYPVSVKSGSTCTDGKWRLRAGTEHNRKFWQEIVEGFCERKYCKEINTRIQLKKDEMMVKGMRIVIRAQLGVKRDRKGMYF